MYCTSGTTHTQLRFMSHDVVFVELFVVQTFYGRRAAAGPAGGKNGKRCASCC